MCVCRTDIDPSRFDAFQLMIRRLLTYARGVADFKIFEFEAEVLLMTSQRRCFYSEQASLETGVSVAINGFQNF